MYNIFKQLDVLIHKSTSINESEIPDDLKTEEEDYETAESGEKMAMQQIIDRLLSDEPSGGGGDGTDISKSENPLSDVKRGKGKGVDKTFKDSTMDDLKDVDTVVDDGDDDLSMSDDDYEFDDFDYEDNDSSGGESDSDNYESEDGEFNDSDMGDESEYDFGDAGDESGDIEDSDSTDGDSDSDDFGDAGDESGDIEDSDSTDGDSDSDDFGDVDYDDTLDYDAEDYDSLESEIEDALDRMKDSASTKAEKEKLEEMSDIFVDDSDEKSTKDKIDELNKEIEKTLDDSSKTGSGELAGETLDSVPDDKSLSDDMEKAGFDKKDIDDMKKSKDVDMSGEIDEDKVAKEAIEEMDKKAKGRGEEAGSSLSRTIMRGVLKGKISNMEWKEMVGIFLKSKSKSSGGSFTKSRSTGWGDKKHLWRDAIMPKSVVSGGDIFEINCFIDFSGSVSQPLVFTFLHRVLELCNKLSFDIVNVYGFGDKLSKPFIIKRKDLPKGKDESKIEEFLKKMWTFIDEQYLGGSIENFEEVAKEILKIKRKDHNTPILIFGDGLWQVAYPNPKPPIYLKELCSRYLKDILILIYYYDFKEYVDGLLSPEIAYLKDIVGVKHIVTTKVDELKS